MNVTEILALLQTVGYPVIIAALAYGFAELSKAWNIKSRWIPFINVGIGLIAAGISFLIGILPCSTPIEIIASIGACLVSALGAGGSYDLFKTKTTPAAIEPVTDYTEAVKFYGVPAEDTPEAPITHGASEALPESREG